MREGKDKPGMNRTPQKPPKKAAGQPTPLAAEIKAEAERQGMSASKLAESAGMSRNALHPFFRGDVLSPGIETIRAIERVLKRKFTDDAIAAEASVAPAISRDSVEISDDSLLITVTIEGLAEAGAFRPVDWFAGTDLGNVVYVPEPETTGLRHFGFRVVGDSVDLLGIFDGDVVICVDPWESGADLGTGDVVVVENILNGGHTRELTLKELEISASGHVLNPRSSNPKHRPIPLPRDDDPNDGREVRIVGVVVSVSRKRPVRFRPRFKGGRR